MGPIHAYGQSARGTRYLDVFDRIQLSGRPLKIEHSEVFLADSLRRQFAQRHAGAGGPPMEKLADFGIKFVNGTAHFHGRPAASSSSRVAASCSLRSTLLRSRSTSTRSSGCSVCRGGSAWATSRGSWPLSTAQVPAASFEDQTPSAAKRSARQALSTASLPATWAHRYHRIDSAPTSRRRPRGIGAKSSRAGGPYSAFPWPATVDWSIANQCRSAPGS